MGPQNHHDGDDPDAIIKDFRALLDKTQVAAHCVAIYCGTGEFIKHKSRNKCNYRTNNCLQWSSVCPMELRFQLRVQMMNTYLGCVDAQEASAGMEGMDGMTAYG
jgi:hypothetical protein